MGVDGFADRLRELQGDLSGRAAAKAAGLKSSTYQALLDGGKPSLETLVTIAKARSVDIRWLATGEGQKFAGGDAQPPQAGFNAELLGRVVDRIARVYREEGVRLPDVELGRLAAEKYSEIIDLAGDPDEWSGFLEVVASRVRKAIRAAAAEPNTVKRGA